MFHLASIHYTCYSERGETKLTGSSPNGAFNRLLQVATSGNLLSAFDYLALGASAQPSIGTSPYLYAEIARVPFSAKGIAELRFAPPNRASIILSYEYRNEGQNQVVLYEWGASDVATFQGAINTRGLFDPPLQLAPGEWVRFYYAPQVIVYPTVVMRPQEHLQVQFTMGGIGLSGMARLLSGDGNSLVWRQLIRNSTYQYYLIEAPATLTGPQTLSWGYRYDIGGSTVDLSAYGTSFFTVSPYPRLLVYADTGEQVLELGSVAPVGTTLTFKGYSLFLSLQAKV